MYDQAGIPDEVRRSIDGARSSVWVWSPWVGRHAPALQDALRAAVGRGVEVYLVALPETEVTAALRASLESLRNDLPHVVLEHRMHQKIVVVDERLTFLGSMNVLSHAALPSARRREVMVLFEGRQFAEGLLRFEHADDLRDPPPCPACGEQMWHANERKKPKPGWYWYCGRTVDGGRCQCSTPFVRSGRPR
jgi:phosphatidylserine/phosphatidylglycerophosphate/cardiolipin synthase-like enzyme